MDNNFFNHLYETLVHKKNELTNKIKESPVYQHVKIYMFSKSAQEAGYDMSTDSDLRKDLHKPLKFAMGVLFVGLGFFVIWGGLAPLDSAAIASGNIIIEGNHKTVQSLRGGIVEKIYVREGQEVKAGDLLLKFDPTEAYADYQITTSQLAFLKAENLRLKAEQTNAESIIWDGYDFNRDSMEVVQIIRTQEQLFKNNRKLLTGNIDILNEQIKQRMEEIKGLQIQLQSAETQLANYKEELEGAEVLFEKGLYQKPRLLDIRNRIASAEGSIGQINARMLESHKVISENNLKILNVENDYRKRLNDESKENHVRLLDITEKYLAAKEAYERISVTSPSDGVVAELRVHTIGGVVGPGAPIMDIVPKHEKLLVEVKVPTTEIENIHLGMVAKVQIGAYKARMVPRLDGTVIYVGADKLVEQQQGGNIHQIGQGQMQFYLARIEINEKELDRLTADVKLYPGMPATAFLVKGSRTFLQYLLSPIIDSFYRAFKEK